MYKNYSANDEFKNIDISIHFSNVFNYPPKNTLYLISNAYKFLQDIKQGGNVPDLPLLINRPGTKYVLVARTRLYKPLCRLVGRSVGQSETDCSEYATYGNQPCFTRFFIIQ